VDVGASVGEVAAASAVEPGAVDELRLRPIGQRHPLDLVLVELQPEALLDPVEQFEAIGVGTIHSPQSERRAGRDGG
jgi:hypothetical protein